MKKVSMIPPHHWFFKNSLVLLKDPLAFDTNNFKEHGDIYDVNFTALKIYVLSNPEHIQEVLVSNKKNYP